MSEKRNEHNDSSGSDRQREMFSQCLLSDFTEEMLRDPAQRKEYVQAVLNLQKDQKEMLFPLAYTSDEQDDLSMMGLL